MDPPPTRPAFTSDLTDVEARWIVNVVKWGENNCAKLAVMAEIPVSRCVVR